MKDYYKRDAKYIMGGRTMQEVADAVRWVQRRNGAGGQQGTVHSADCGAGETWVHNATAVDWPQFACVKIQLSGPEAPPVWAYEPHRMYGQLAGAKDASAAIGIAVEPIAANKLGRVLMIGMTPAQLTIPSGVSNIRCATPGADGTLVAAESGPFRVLTLYGSGSERWSILQLGGSSGVSGEKVTKTLTEATVALGDLEKNTVYNCTTPLRSLSFTVTGDWAETIIMFTPATGFALSISGTRTFAWGQGAILPGKRYIFSIAGTVINMAQI